MIFTETKLKGAFVIELEKMEDSRGFFARSWDKKEFYKRGLRDVFVQNSISFNKLKGTLRGLHFQIEPQEEKLVFCTKGSIFDVIIDLRKNSPTFKKWIYVELTAKNYKLLYIPKGFAHGFQTMEDNTEVLYQISEFYDKNRSGGIRWDDPFFAIKWPFKISMISERDKSFPDFHE